MMREEELIQALSAFFRESDRIPVGPGDDALILKAYTGRPLILTVDSQVEGVHFDLRLMRLPQVGHRALAAALSDIAAMGGIPLTFLVNLEVPPQYPIGELKTLYEGFQELMEAFCISPGGGNINRDSRLGLVITVIGELPDPLYLLRRQGAQDGDYLVLTGEVGGARAGLELLRRPELAQKLRPVEAEALKARFLHPWPRIEEMQALLREGKPHAAIDISDGLGVDAWRVAQASEQTLVLVIEEERLPLMPGVETVARALGEDPVLFALGSGEEYEVLLSVSGEELEKLRGAGKELHVIGRVETRWRAGAVLRRTSGEEVPLQEIGFDQLAQHHLGKEDARHV